MNNTTKENDFDLHLKNPPKRIFAYQHSNPGNQIMGVAIDAISGKILEAVILPTRQRVMLGLGIGNEDAQAHVSYRRFGGAQGYKLIWIEDPETDPRTQPVKERLVEKAQNAIAQAQKPQEEPIIERDVDVVSELTEQLVKQGATQAQAQAQPQKVEKKPNNTKGFF